MSGIRSEYITMFLHCLTYFWLPKTDFAHTIIKRDPNLNLIDSSEQ